MIALIAASAVYLVATQAALAAPTIAYKDCLKQAAVQAKKDKIGGDAYEAYARNACGAQITGLRDALIGFEVKNGTKRKDAAADADMTVDDYLASSVDNYKFLSGIDADNARAEAAKAKAAAPAPTPAAQATPASAPQPPK
ncbi:MAG TPA: hypothetical protein VIZ66_05065 [Sphingomicrobium sp.]